MGSDKQFLFMKMFNTNNHSRDGDTLRFWWAHSKQPKGGHESETMNAPYTVQTWMYTTSLCGREVSLKLDSRCTLKTGRNTCVVAIYCNIGKQYHHEALLLVHPLQNNAKYDTIYTLKRKAIKVSYFRFGSADCCATEVNNTYGNKKSGLYGWITLQTTAVKYSPTSEGYTWLTRLYAEHNFCTQSIVLHIFVQMCFGSDLPLWYMVTSFGNGRKSAR